MQDLPAFLYKHADQGTQVSDQEHDWDAPVSYPLATYYIVYAEELVVMQE